MPRPAWARNLALQWIVCRAGALLDGRAPLLGQSKRICSEQACRFVRRCVRAAAWRVRRRQATATDSWHARKGAARDVYRSNSCVALAPWSQQQYSQQKA